MDFCFSCFYWDFVLLILGAIISVFCTLFVIKYFKPDLEIENAEYKNGWIRIYVKNRNRKYAATNLSIEAAAVRDSFTYHLKFDRSSFILLPPLNRNAKENGPHVRVFQSFDIEPSTSVIIGEKITMNDFIALLELPDSVLRIRVHAHHSFTGFGQWFETSFKLSNNVFSKLKTNQN